jgi:hypothetical protein
MNEGADAAHYQCHERRKRIHLQREVGMKAPGIDPRPQRHAQDAARWQGEQFYEGDQRNSEWNKNRARSDDADGAAALARAQKDVEEKPESREQQDKC